MSHRVIVFEDRFWKRLYPITLSRPSFDCRAGVGTLARRIIGQLARREIKRIEFLCRPALRPLVEREYPGHAVNHETEGDVLFLNGRMLALGESLDDLIHVLGKAVSVQHNGELLGARVTGTAAPAFGRRLMEVLEKGEPAPFPEDHVVAAAPSGLRMAEHLWDLVAWNADTLADDFEWVSRPSLQHAPDPAPGARILGRERILCREGVRLEAGAVLDAGPGPIFLGEDVHVLHNAVVVGPVSLGSRSRVKAGSRIEGPVTTGPCSKLGGEIEGSILQGYANKQHDGFLGHAYVGAWTNLGAGTNNSDLKNNYSTVRVWTPEGEVDTGSRFVGLFVGDHSKSAIGTQFNTGTVVGFSSNVFGPGFPPKHVPSFSWGGAGGLTGYDLEKALAVARTVMQRRKVDLEPADEVLFRSIHDDTKGSRPG